MKNRFRPAVESLCCRTLPSAGLTTSLWGGVLVITRTDATRAVTIDIRTTPLNPRRHTGVKGLVVVEGVAKFAAARVKSVEVEQGHLPRGYDQSISFRANSGGSTFAHTSHARPVAPTVVATPARRFLRRPRS